MTCPDPTLLARLLEGELSEAEQNELTQHLDGCARCQQAVQELASGGRTWTDVAAYLQREHGRTEKEPALQQAVAELAGPVRGDDTQTEPRAADDNALDFLAPSTKPGSLGRLDHYEVIEVIGRGGMGVVLKAFDEALHRVVAVKVLSPQLATNATARRRFGREAKAGAAVCHDHVVTIHAVEEDKPVPYLVMQCVAGASLQDKLDRDGPLGVKEILRIGLQTAEGLAAAHKQGLVHRDIKPANILLENGVERVKITDFGLARAVDDASLTQSGVVAGTPQYMSPEQAQGEPVDHRSDLFSLGSVLYAMCTGRPPFRATGTMAVLKRVCEDTPRPIREVSPDIPDWLCDIIAKLHAKKPADRFQSATEVADLLSRHLAHLQQPALAPPPAPIVQASGVRRPAPVVEAAAPVTPPLISYPPFDRKRALLVVMTTFVILALVVFATIRYEIAPMLSATILTAVFVAGLFLAWPPRSRSRQPLIVTLVFVAIGGAAFAWLDYTHPSWWKDPFFPDRQPDQTPGSVSINWNDPDVEMVIDKGEGTSYRSRQSPFLQRLNPGMYMLRAMKGEKLLFEGKLSVAPGEERVVDLSGFVWGPPPLAKAPFTGEEAKQHQEAWARHLGVPVEVENAIGMKFRLIPPGEFLMGMSPEEIVAANKDRPPDHWLLSSTKTSGPQHKVTLSRPFYCATTEVTIGQFRKFVQATGYQTDAEKDGKGGARWNQQEKKMTQDPSLIWKTPGYDVIDSSPVTQVTWNDAVAFCNWLSGVQGLGEAYRSIQGPWSRPTGAQGYRLPTEAQWEFACRAGATTNYFWATDERMLGNYAWYSENSSGKAHPVGTKVANPFGLFDMQGNVSELCQDFHDLKSYPSVDEIDPAGAPQGTCYVRRGANFASQSKDCASAQRLLGLPFDVRHDDTGFRVVQDVLPAVKASPPPLAKAPFTAEEAKQHQETWAKHLGVPVETTNSAGIKLALIPPGEFNMGLTAAEIDAAITRIKNRPNDNWLVYAYKTSGPLHKVVLTKPYYAATTHVTIGQFREFVKAKQYLTDAERDGGGSRWDELQKKMIQDPKLTWKAPGYDVTDQSPVTQVAWNDAVAFCNWLSAKEGLGQPYELVEGSWRPTSAPGYRLPTEAQWEYACRAGTTSLHFGGNDEEAFARHAWFLQNSNGKAQPVGAKWPNAFGLFDMQGNADHFCQDFFDPKYYERNERYDPLGPDTGLPQVQPHVRRGSSWGASADAYVSGLRMSLDLKAAQSGIGFRIVRDIPTNSAKTLVSRDAWIETVSALGAEEQVKAVAATLKELNPGFDGHVEPFIQDGVVVHLALNSDWLADISPLRALTGLQRLNLDWNKEGGDNAKYSDLSPLRGLSLKALYLHSTHVRDLSPLRNMPLEELYIDHTGVRDLSPLLGMHLKYIDISLTRVGDLDVIDQNLEVLRTLKDLKTINGRPAADCLKEAALHPWIRHVATLPAEEQVKSVAAKLKELNPDFGGDVGSSINHGVVTQLTLLTDRVTDIWPVRALQRLEQLDCTASGPGKGRLSDLSPLRGMHLKSLDCRWTRVTDLSPLKGMDLKELHCDLDPAREAPLLRSIKTLENINGKTAADVWKAMDPKSLEAADCLARGWNFAREEKWENAEAEFKKAVQARPDDPQIWKWRGLIQAEEKRNEQASADFNKALDLVKVDPDENPMKPWSHDRAGIDDELCRWDEVHARVAKLRPKDARLWIARTRWFAYRGEWKAAGEASAQVVARDPKNLSAWFMDAPLRFQNGDVDGYRRDCREMLARFGQREDAWSADLVAKSCLLAPDAVENLDSAIKQAHRAIKDTENSPYYGWYLLCATLADYRARDWERGIKRANSVLACPQEPSRDAMAHIILAMSLHQGGQAALARNSLAEARVLMDKRMPQVNRGEHFNDNWSDWLRGQILLREAEALIDKDQAGSKK